MSLLPLILATYLEPEKKPHRELEPLPGAPAEVVGPQEHRHVTISWLPLQALIPMASLSIEARLAEKISVTGHGGYGSVRVRVDGLERRRIVQLGGNASYYLAGDFEHGGIHVGAAAQWTRVAGPGEVSTSTIRTGLLLGPLLGFKWVHTSGFTLDSQLGVGFLVAETSGAAPNDREQITALLGNVGVGFTF